MQALRRIFTLCLLLMPLGCVKHAATVEVVPCEIRVFVALCDNATQGIAPVGAKIGNGDDPEGNLYWGCSDGLSAFFRKSSAWKLLKSEKDLSHQVMRRLTFQHVKSGKTLIADAYRGSEMKACVADFESSLASGSHELTAFIGHNGLMDFTLNLPTSKPASSGDSIVLCCHSQSYFAPRLTALGSRPILLTQQNMYPGAFLLHDALEVWFKQGSMSEIRQAAGKAYAKNQKIRESAARGVFANLQLTE